jgi:hypothetical protein
VSCASSASSASGGRLCAILALLCALLYFLSILFQDALSYNAHQTGLAFILPTTVVVVASAVAGRGLALARAEWPIDTSSSGYGSVLFRSQMWILECPA